MILLMILLIKTYNNLDNETYNDTVNKSICNQFHQIDDELIYEPN